MPKDSPPLIGNEQGVSVAYESDWLKAALDQAARKAGYESWWLLDEFSLAVTQYLRQDYSPEVIEIPTLERVVRATLRDIGYHEIAARFRAINPFQFISLTECFTAAGSNQEAIFFRRLSDRIKTLHAAKVRHFHFYGLQGCVTRLSGSDPAVRARIIDSVREAVAALSWRSEMLCTVR